MNPTWHRRLTQLFLVFNSLFWLPWGLINLIWPTSWSGDVIQNLDVYDLSHAVARTEVRAMYGGLQMAIGAFALLGALRPRYRDAALTFFVLALTGLAACRFAGMLAEGDGTYLSFGADIPPGRYNQSGLAMYELPNMILAWALLLTRPRRRPESESEEVQHLRTENAVLREELNARSPTATDTA